MRFRERSSREENSNEAIDGGENCCSDVPAEARRGGI